MSDNADSSDEDNNGMLAAAAGGGALGGAAAYGGKDPYHMAGVRSASAYTSDTANTSGAGTYMNYENPSEQQTAPVQTQSYALPTEPAQPVNQQQPSSFLGGEPANDDSLARHNSQYGNWMAPAAAGVAGAGAGAVGMDAYRRHQQDAAVPETDAIDHAKKEAVPQEDASATPTQESSAGVGNASAIPLGGKEAEGAHETGEFFPRVVRHDTDISVSHLHVPGKFPRQGSR